MENIYLLLFKNYEFLNMFHRFYLQNKKNNEVSFLKIS